MNNAKRTKTETSEREYLRTLRSGLIRLRSFHEAGETCYDKERSWTERTYGWHNALFPPEYRRCCLSGKEFHMSAACDLYYYMAGFYEKTTGQRAPHNFELNLAWKSCVQTQTEGWDDAHQTALIGMIAGCTRWSADDRIRDAGELLRTDQARMLLSRIRP